MCCQGAQRCHAKGTNSALAGWCEPHHPTCTCAAASRRSCQRRLCCWPEADSAAVSDAGTHKQNLTLQALRLQGHLQETPQPHRRHCSYWPELQAMHEANKARKAHPAGTRAAGAASGDTTAAASGGVAVGGTILTGADKGRSAAAAAEPAAFAAPAGFAAADFAPAGFAGAAAGPRRRGLGWEACCTAAMTGVTAAGCTMRTS